MTAIVYTTVGKGQVVDRVDDTATATAWWIAWGTGGSSSGSTATAGDTALQAEATEVRATGVLSQPAADTNQFVGVLTNQKAGGKIIEEVMLVTAATGGVCTIRANHGGVALATGDSITYTVTLQQT